MALACRSPEGGTVSERAAQTVPSTVDSRIQLGRALHRRGRFDSSRAVLIPLVDQAKAVGDSLTAAKALTVLGVASRLEGDYRAADSLQREALALKLALGAEDEFASSYNALGLLAWDQQRSIEGLGLLQQAVHFARAAGDREALFAPLINIGLIQTDLGNFDSARTRFTDALAVSRGLGNARGEGLALNNLGMLDNWVGDPQSALDPLRRALDLYRSIEFVAGEQNALAQLGSAYSALGLPSRAIAVLDTAIAQSRAFGLRYDEALNLDALADVYLTAGNIQRALELYEAVWAIEEELGLHEATGRTRRKVAEVYQFLGNAELAAHHAEAALALHQATGAKFEAFADLVLLAEVSGESGHRARSARYLRAAQELARALDARSARMDVALAEARIASAANNMSRVLRVLDAATADLSAGGYDTEWEAEALRARAYRSLGRLAAAARAGRRAVAAVEKVRGGFGSGALRTTYLAQRAEAYADLVEVLWQLGERHEAFEVADAVRGRALLEHIAAARSADAPSSGSMATIAGSEAVLRRVEQLLSQIELLEAIPPTERDTAVTNEIRRLQARVAEGREAYEVTSVRAAELQGPRAALLGVARASARKVQRALHPGQVILEYLVTRDRLLVFVVSPDTIEIVEVAATELSLTNRVRLARDLLGDRTADPAILSPVLEGLHELLIRPAAESGRLQAARHLIVVPHGVLSYLPFAALKDVASGRYLVEDYVLSYVPTAGAVPLLREAEPDDRTRGAGRARVEVFAPLPDQLPGTVLEARAVDNALRGSRVHIGARATEGRVRRALAGDRVVHVATHGILNARSPMFSRIELAPGSRNGNADDGRLEVHEILGLTVNSPLVFLSGCETGLGVAWTTEFIRGEDYTTLGQAFLYAGARNVIATLWRIDDPGAAAFVERFYSAFNEISPAEALAAAQRQMMSSVLYNSPYYWAAYQLAGAGEIGAK